MKIGIDIGGSHIAVAIVNEEGKIVQKIEQDVKMQSDMAQYIVNYVDNAIEKLSKSGDIEAIGIAAPGNPKKEIITNLVNLGIEKLDFKDIITKYNVPVKSINDAKAAALAEKQYGALQGTKDSVFLCLGTGIGGAVFLNNQLLQANRNPRFEIGHIVIDKNGPLCHCQKRGCFETYCSMKRLKERLQIVLEKQMRENGYDVTIQDVNQLKALLKENKENEEIQSVLEEYINNLIIGLSNVIDIFEPEVVCLGGSFSYFEDILYYPLREQMEKRRYVFNKQVLPEIRLAKLRNEAGIIGATLI